MNGLTFIAMMTMRTAPSPQPPTGFGVSLAESIALGITYTIRGCTRARKLIFSLLVCETVITASALQRVHVIKALSNTEATLAKEKSE